MVTLKEISLENFDSVIALSVRPDQRDLVATNVESIAQAYVQPGCTPLAVCVGEKPVGFVMYCVDPDDGEWWLYRLMVDAREQGKGYGRAALTQVLERVHASGGHPRMFLGVDPSGGASLHLYESMGFHPNGQVFGKEHIMVLNWDDSL